MTEHSLERTLEWEPAAQPTVLEHVTFPAPPFIAGTRKVTIQRDEDLRLNFVAEGVLVNRNELRERHQAMDSVAAGTSMDTDEVSFDAHSGRCTLNAFFYEFPDATISADQTRFRHEGRVDRFARTWTQKFVVGEGGAPNFAPIGAPAWRSDWFINGPHAPVGMRSTRRRQTVRFSREREFGSVQTPELPLGDDGRDHFVVDAGTLRFAVCQVPKGRASEWCRAMSIEFRAPIPDEETRVAVAEIVSFVLGRRLIPLGSTVFDDTGWTVEEEMVNPASDELRALCSGSEFSPVPLGVLSEDVEEILAKLVPSYLRVRDAMGLRNALWGYWSACEASTPIDLAIFRAAVEALKKGWFASTGEKSNGSYMPKEDFDKATSDVFATVQERIATHPEATSILNRLRGAYERGSNEQVRAFFSEIELRIGVAENAARRAANVPAHGSITTGGNIKVLVKHGYAFRTLFARTFLRLLGYDGPYVDYTTLGFPSRALDEPAGGDGLRAGG